jgi:hypothetical protein
MTGTISAFSQILKPVEELETSGWQASSTRGDVSPSGNAASSELPPKTCPVFEEEPR